MVPEVQIQKRAHCCASPRPTLPRPVHEKMTNSLYCISFTIVILYILSALALSGANAAQVSAFAESRAEEFIALTGARRHCLTECDCYKNSAIYGADTAHLCFECARLRNNTCQVVAACPLGYICSRDPLYSATTSEFSCLDPAANDTNPDEGENCLVDQDCVKIFHGPLPQRQVYTFNGHCLPTSKCQYPLYGILPGATIALELTTRPFDHRTCAPKAHSTTCSGLSDCFPLPTFGATHFVYNPEMECNNATNNCIPKEVAGSKSEFNFLLQANTTMPQVDRLTDKKRSIADRIRDIIEASTIDKGTSRGDNSTTGTEIGLFRDCDSDEQCQSLGHLVDSDGHTNCYSCLPTLKQIFNSDGSKQWNATKVCMKTDSGCASQLCHRGSCIGKACQSDYDCLEIAGMARHCHTCDLARGICSAKRICSQGSFCVSENSYNSLCRSSVMECNSNGKSDASLVLEETWQRHHLLCVPTGTDGLGYVRYRDSPAPPAPKRGETHAADSFKLMRQHDALKVSNSRKDNLRRATHPPPSTKAEPRNTKNLGIIDLDSITIDDISEGRAKALFSREYAGNGGDGRQEIPSRVIQYTPAQTRQQTLRMLNPVPLVAVVDEVQSGDTNGDAGEPTGIAPPSVQGPPTIPVVQVSDEGDVLADSTTSNTGDTTATVNHPQKRDAKGKSSLTQSSFSPQSITDIFNSYMNAVYVILAVLAVLLVILIITCFTTTPTQVTYAKTEISPGPSPSSTSPTSNTTTPFALLSHNTRSGGGGNSMMGYSSQTTAATLAGTQSGVPHSRGRFSTGLKL